jgi:hypothetical protein
VPDDRNPQGSESLFARFPAAKSRSVILIKTCLDKMPGTTLTNSRIERHLKLSRQRPKLSVIFRPDRIVCREYRQNLKY